MAGKRRVGLEGAHLTAELDPQGSFEVVDRARDLRERVLEQTFSPNANGDERLDGPPSVETDVRRSGLLILLALGVVDEDLEFGAERHEEGVLRQEETALGLLVSCANPS